MSIAGHVNQQISKQPVYEPRGHLGPDLRELLERDLEFVQRVIARLVHPRRLGCGTDEESGEQIRQGRMIVTVADQASKQVRATKEERILRRCSAHHDMVAA